MTLTPAQWATLEAVADRIVPPDGFAGAWQAGVGDYLMRQFDGGDLQEHLGVYRAGLDSLDREAEVREGQPFPALPPERQDSLLSHVESGHPTAPWAIDPQRFFRTLVAHVMEGFYADPGNGGNRDGISWRMIGFEVRG